MSLDRPSPRRLLIVGNYARTNQHSQRLYAAFVADAARDAMGADNVRTWAQKGLFARFPWPARLKKLGLDLDRYLVAPLECLFQSADILFIADNSNAWYARFLRHRTIIVGCHDMLPYLAGAGRVEGWRPSAPTRGFTKANIAAMRKANLVVSVSATTADVLAELGIERVRVILHGQLQSFPPPEPVPGIDTATLPRTFFHVGAGKFAKNSELMVDAFDRLPAADDARLLLVGGAAETVRARSRFPDRIVALGQLTAGQIRHVYEHCAALVMPSRYEGFGLPVIEAQSLGCPAIASDGGALDEVMVDGPLKLRQPIPPDALAAAMQRVIADPAFRTEIIAKGRANAARFEREKAAAAYRALFAELAAEPGQRSL